MSNVHTVRSELLLLLCEVIIKLLRYMPHSPYLDIKRSARNCTDRSHWRSTHSFCSTSQLSCQLMLITGQIWTPGTLSMSSMCSFRSSKLFLPGAYNYCYISRPILAYITPAIKAKLRRKKIVCGGLVGLKRLTPSPHRLAEILPIAIKLD